MSTLGNIEPADVFKFFGDISMIPRESGNIKSISDYLVSYARNKGLYVRQDAVGNVIIKKPATAGREMDAGVIIQGHMDMVAEKKPESKHNFKTDGLELYVEDGYVKAKDTTLGGDDGIAIAYALAILDSDTISHPALEAIFTVNEETGMDGARELDMFDIDGKYMLNIDSEDEGIFTAGCAGGAKVRANISYRTILTEGNYCVVKVSGLIGGHSGIEIDKERANANVIMARVLKRMIDKCFVECISIRGGNMDNAIPRECSAELLISDDNLQDAISVVNNMNDILKKEFSVTDKDINVSITVEKKCSNTVMVPEDFRSIIFFLSTAPNGVQHMNMDIKGLVETSLNLGILYTEDNCTTAVFAVRSSVESRKQCLVEKLEILAENAGGFTEVRGVYPAWEYKKNSYLRDTAVETYREMYGKEPCVDIIHAGLECGFINEKKPEIDIISLGPDLCDIHTTEEKMSIESVARVYKFILELLKKLH